MSWYYNNGTAIECLRENRKRNRRSPSTSLRADQWDQQKKSKAVQEEISCAGQHFLSHRGLW
jgi:hypothetical protein